MEGKEKGKIWCEHPKQSHRVINNGGVYCSICGQTNLYKSFKLKDDNGNVVFVGNAMECSKYVNLKTLQNEK